MEKRKFLVVVDPSHERHLALERMLDIVTQRRESIANFHLLVGFEGADKADPNAPSEVIRGKQWFDELMAPVDATGVDYTVEFFWTANWRKSITDAAERFECDTIMLCESSAEHKRGITDSKWDLVRQARCDVVIVDEGTEAPIKTILAAVNTQAKDAGHQALNDRILERGKFLAEYFNADYHVVNAYTDSENFPDRQKISRMSGLPREKIYRDMGKPEDVIAATAERIGADMVIIGISPRTGLSAKFASHTTEKVMEKITVDVVALN
ncbi:MAG: universal stress protein [Xanthomonadales bacterium]|nr:universal stress protein [Gammaproteobacteria bacterium]MBT8049810.1 universal stress protein [Gammaproteobacteria bacterium]MBT8056114.1 universal stress protein [Gammaproteobacteria bacterium]NNL03868.1 universal stress protein [Xanthomonadales bacterium]